MVASSTRRGIDRRFQPIGSSHFFQEGNMTQSRRKARELLRLLPSGVAGLSMSLASADASAFAVAEHPERPAEQSAIASSRSAATSPARWSNTPRMPSRSSPSTPSCCSPGGATVAGTTADGTMAGSATAASAMADGIMAASATAAGTTAASATGNTGGLTTSGGGQRFQRPTQRLARDLHQPVERLASSRMR